MKVLLVDDHLVVRAGLKALLETIQHIDVVGEAASGEEAVEKVRTLKPDIVIMDLSMPGMGGVHATRRITELGSGAKVLVVTIHNEDERVALALEAGAAGFLNKSAADTDLLGAVEAVARGYVYLPSPAATLLRRRKVPSQKTRPEVLSSRELAVIELYAHGFTAKEMAKEMSLSSKTVEGYLARAKTKLGLRTRHDIVRFALEAGLLRSRNER